MAVRSPSGKCLSFAAMYPLPLGKPTLNPGQYSAGIAAGRKPVPVYSPTSASPVLAEVTLAPIFKPTALLPLLGLPAPRLRTKAVPVAPASLAAEEAQRLFADMFETMYGAAGIGL